MTVGKPSVTATHGYSDRHEIEPRRTEHLLAVAALVAILVGDAIAFYQLAALAMPDAQDWVVGLLVAALSVAATVSMHHAGRAARARRAGDDQPGKPWAHFLVLAWAGLGCVSVWFRLAAAGAAAPVADADVFGTVVNTAAATQVPLAALLLMLYLVGGATAYGIGYRMHNPARSAYFRARRAYRRAERAHHRAVWWRDRVYAGPSRWTLPFRRRRGLQPRGPVMDERRHAAATPVSVEDWAEQQPQQHSQSIAAVASEPTVGDIALRKERAEARARAQAQQLRQFARHQLAIALGEPASSSGVFDGGDALSRADRTDEMNYA